MSATAVDLAFLKHDLAIKNLNRLARLDVPTAPPRAFDSDFSRPHRLSLKLLKRWSEDNRGSIQKAIKDQVLGSSKDKIDWNTAFLPFMESTAVYLRDWDSYRRAWEKYRAVKNSDKKDLKKLNDAVRLYHDAFRDIEDLAKMWGMDFVQLCDLTQELHQGQAAWDGPFCGAFFTTDAQNITPFLGVVFKGTNPLNRREVNVDYDYDLTTAVGYLGGSKVSNGVYTGLFRNVEKIKDPPYINIRNQLGELASKLHNTVRGPVRAHVTGHSMGGSYATLYYAQMLIDTLDGRFPEPIIPTDAYTFGAPRVGSKLWAELYSALVDGHDGQSWRIVHDQDIVPQVPPTSSKNDQVDFHHVDRGMRIYRHKPPVSIDTERGLVHPPPYHIKSIHDWIRADLQTKDHVPKPYYDAMVYAIYQQELSNSTS